MSDAFEAALAELEALSRALQEALAASDLEAAARHAARREAIAAALDVRHLDNAEVEAAAPALERAVAANRALQHAVSEMRDGVGRELQSEKMRSQLRQAYAP